MLHWICSYELKTPGLWSTTEFQWGSICYYRTSMVSPWALRQIIWVGSPACSYCLLSPAVHCRERDWKSSSCKMILHLIEHVGKWKRLFANKFCLQLFPGGLRWKRLDFWFFCCCFWGVVFCFVGSGWGGLLFFGEVVGFLWGVLWFVSFVCFFKIWCFLKANKCAC